MEHESNVPKKKKESFDEHFLFDRKQNYVKIKYLLSSIFSSLKKQKKKQH